MSALPPTPDLNKTNWIVQVNESVLRMTSDSDDERYWKKRSIYRIPACITGLNSKAYSPEAVSFGPHHHGEDHLQPMERHKRHALLHFLRRSGKPVEHFLKSLSEVRGELEDSYDSLNPKWKEGGGDGEVDLLELMITDGCFMLEILRTMRREVRDYANNDPIFGDLGGFCIFSYLKRDMLMLENQLPMLLLDRLVAAERDGEQDDEYINRHIHYFYLPETPFERMGKCLHVLDALRKSLLLPENPDKAAPEKFEMIPSATKLEEAGIRLEKSETRSLEDISFVNGVLRLPALLVRDSTESMFLNLMAFERFHHGVGYRVTAYVYFINDIINTERDVALLSSRGIIESFLGSDEVVARLINSLNKNTVLDFDNRLSAVRKKVSMYCKKPWHKWRANLMQTYFRSPWSLLSLIGAIFLFTLTTIQTIFTVSPHG